MPQTQGFWGGSVVAMDHRTWAYDREGHPISIERWGQLHADDAYRVVGADQVGPYFVSTVWLGIDHSFDRSGPPVIFETMVFAASPEVEGLGPDLDCSRYTTPQAALAGHQEAVVLVRATTQEVPTQVEES